MRYKYRKAGILLLGVALGTIYLVAPGKPSKELAAPFYGRNIAHRGLHSGDSQVPENSLPAFRAAAEAGYGVELDLQMTKDGQVVVYHDDNLKRVCGVEGSIEDMSFHQLRRLTLFGAKEHIPLFSEVLDIIDGRVPMIVELKRSKRNRELCEATLELLRAYDGDYCVESFDPEIVAWFRYNAPDILRGQLSSVPHELRNHTGRIKAYLVGHLLTNFMTRPHFVAYGLEKKPLTVCLCEKMGAMKVCWTSLEPKNEVENDVVIFQHYHPVVKFK